MSELSKLKWHCRRGVKELDLVLTTYLEQYYETAEANEQAAFKALLKLEDPILFDMLVGNAQASDANQQALIAHLGTIIARRFEQ